LLGSRPQNNYTNQQRRVLKMDEVRWRTAASAGLLLALACIANADEISPADDAASMRLLPADSEIRLRLLEPIASNSHKHGDKFALEVIEPVTIDGVALIPAGAKGEGQVVHAAKGGFGGRAGELILASRSVSVGGQTVKLRSFSAGNGQDRVNLALGLSFAVVGIFVTGKDIALPAGTEVFAKVSADTMLLPIAQTQSPPAIDSQPSATEPTSTEINENESSQQ
jgi:hypothetical protein